MRRPSFQFYPADWRNNANLRRCTPAARGVWLDILCVLHDSDEYGIVHWPLADLANSANAPIKLVRELVEKNVLKGCDKQLADAFVYVPRSGRRDGEPVTLVAIQAGPVWYSSRMVKDEYVRTIRGESSRFGDGNGDAPKAAPKPPKGDGSTSSSSTTSPSLRSGGEKPQLRSGPPPTKPEDVSDGTWTDWLQLRRTKRAPVTNTVLDGARAEAGKAGMPLQRFLEIWCMRGSQGLQAEWIRADERGAAGQRPNGNKHAAAAAGIFGPSRSMGDVIDV